jgi:BirA family biotin operon repressor/biotin-[acetyl-CoA-carboxylase] ligase
VRNDWLARTVAVGELIRLRTPEDLSGRFAGIDQHGRLLLDTPQGRRTIAAGDVAPARHAAAGVSAA